MLLRKKERKKEPNFAKKEKKKEREKEPKVLLVGKEKKEKKERTNKKYC